MQSIIYIEYFEVTEIKLDPYSKGFFQQNPDIKTFIKLIEENSKDRRVSSQADVELLTITDKQTGGKPRAKSMALTRRHSGDSLRSPPPPYQSASARLNIASNEMGRANSVGSKSPNTWGAAAKAKGAAPPPPKPKPARLSGVPAVHATAIYDYEAMEPGDLSFKAGDVIDVTKKGASENEWWTGKLHGQEGQFPGKSHSPPDFLQVLTSVS